MSGFGNFLRRRWPAMALVASLVLNGFLVGMLAADWVKPRRGFTGERFATFELRRVDERLPKEASDQVAAELRPLGAELSDRLERLRGAAGPRPRGDRRAARHAPRRSFGHAGRGAAGHLRCAAEALA
jgi:hypothetical protein